MFGISQKTEMNTPWSDKFELVHDWDEERWYASKETLLHDEGDDFTFKYKYLIDVLIYGDSKAYVGYNLIMMPTPEYWDEKCIENIAEQLGYDIEQTRKFMADNPDAAMIELASYGKCVHVGGPACQYFEEFENWDDVVVRDEVLNAIATVITPIDRMRGFYLDRYVNRIGETGWDELHCILSNIDPTLAALDRWKKETEEHGE